MIICHTKTCWWATTSTYLQWNYLSVIVWSSGLIIQKTGSGIDVCTHLTCLSDSNISTYCTASDSPHSELRDILYLQKLPLAHPVTGDENFKISILIGAGYYWYFIQDNIVRGDGPAAVQWHLGYLLSGLFICLSLLRHSTFMLQSFHAQPTPKIHATHGHPSSKTPCPVKTPPMMHF